MTLVLAFGNSQQFGMAADRRFTNWDGSGFTDENVKVSSLICPNARLAVAFAGLARAPGFETATWLLETLRDVAKPDYDAEKMLDRFRDRATRDFSRLGVDRHYLRTTFLFAGFYGAYPARWCYARVSNYEHLREYALPVASEEFSLLKLSQAQFTAKEPTPIATAGNPTALNAAAIDELKAMLEQRKPQTALVNKAMAIIREAADDFRSGDSIGKQISALVIPSNPSVPIQTDYDTAVPTNKLFMPNGLVALPQHEIIFRDVVLEKVSDGPNPARYMLLPRNSPCFCGSGKKYKRCHGGPPEKQRVRRGGKD